MHETTGNMWESWFECEDYVRFCKIGDKILPFFSCNKRDDLHKSPEWGFAKLSYLGEGTIYSINGVLQNNDELLHFYAKE